MWFTQSKQARLKEIEIEKGIYSDEDGAMYDVIGVATHTEGSERLVVCRELFDQYRLMVIPVKTFNQTSEPSRFTLVKKL